ncbi:DUF938 domain-containing protein [Aliikangiella sp. G2MR2-5]|uniref:DUF938 domain-containing protein n=1 Tax=Aliikangiella sp. G2MR2-5 TaxID=2788943 RepID=UPI0018AB832D|nr:DUF938 domain-containing protein [Aliikangiella sp. G2MR2-5]
MSKPYSEACERNQKPIFDVIEPYLVSCRSLLELGSGTGQHAIYFGRRLKHLSWQTSDLRSNHHGINQWIKESDIGNILPPIPLDVLNDEWPKTLYEASFSANTAHIMPWEAVEAAFYGLSRVLKPEAPLLIYGPFNYKGKFTSESNCQFDRWLKQQHAHQGIRDFEAMCLLGEKNGFQFEKDIAMPANNRILVWVKKQ